MPTGPGGSLVAGGGDDAAPHVLVDPGESIDLDVQAGLLADLSGYGVHDGLVELEYAARRFPVAVVAALDVQHPSLSVNADDGKPGL